MAKKINYSLRNFINDIHLWLGLASGIILFLVCLSGTVLAFEHEIKDFFSDKITVEQPSKEIDIDIDKLVTSLKTSEKGFVTGVTIPSKNNQPYEFQVKKDIKERRGSIFLMNPYTQEIVKPKTTAADNFMLTMFKLHRWLLLDLKVGRPIVGVATIIFLILAISGIILWFPKKLKWKNFKHGLKIKTNANWKRINHDLHNTLGFYACIFIVIMGLTGLAWSFDSYREGMGKILGSPLFGKRDAPFEIVKKDSISKISLNEAIKITNEELNYNGKLSVTFPTAKNAVYQFRKYNSKSWSPETADKLTVDIYGNMLKKEIFSKKPLNEQIATLVKPLHTGSIFGTFSKTIYFLACLIATSLPITGTIIWLNKLKKKKV
ncbi:PepSY domain-containing protein [Lutibacter sp. B1]|uniref:PepSY-associated TM helix domain-containing protein n=1 Tax=Lutibacter sp. B1 TaxID=2725996 RepID=UPI001456E8E4|nr:PepSY-associated TM helix domain-containing protein [Lutibacter sp. B1]NLP57147.1 PepSY domain-containing protein [Lutibacter sp. B1]